MPPLPSSDGGLIRALRRELKAAAVAADAAPMQAYMKSELPFYGVKSKARKAVARAVFAEHRLDGYDRWHDTVLTLWRGAKRREERYCALDLVGHRFYREHRGWQAFALYEELIVTGAWWDFVDEVAAHRVGELFKSDATRTAKTMRAWSVDADLWRRRTSIICQLRRKEDTDEALLLACIEPSMDSDEFFLRKGIGWALREHAKLRPKAVVRFVKKHRARLSGLSKREALRHLVASGATDPLQ